MGINIVRTLPEEQWREFVVWHPQGNVFHSPEMFQVFAKANGHHPTLWAAVDRSQRPLALLPAVQITLMAGPLRRLTTRAVAYGSILRSSGRESEEALTQLLQEYRRVTARSVLFTELRNLSDMSSMQPVLQQHSFQYEDYLNYLIELERGPEALLQDMSRRTRKQIRRGLRQGKVTVAEVHSRKQLAAWHEVLKKTYLLAQVPLPDRSLFEAAFETLYPKGMVKFLLALVDGACAACSAELIYRDKIYGWYSGMDRAYTSYVPNELLMWHILRWGAEHGYHQYDFGGAGKPDEEYGVRDFKAKFGGDLVCYGRNTLVHAPGRLILGKMGYHAYRYAARLRTWGRDIL